MAPKAPKRDERKMKPRKLSYGSTGENSTPMGADEVKREKEKYRRAQVVIFRLQEAWNDDMGKGKGRVREWLSAVGDLLPTMTEHLMTTPWMVKEVFGRGKWEWIDSMMSKAIKGLLQMEALPTIQEGTWTTPETKARLAVVWHLMVAFEELGYLEKEWDSKGALTDLPAGERLFIWLMVDPGKLGVTGTDIPGFGQMTERELVKAMKAAGPMGVITEMWLEEGRDYKDPEAYRPLLELMGDHQHLMGVHGNMKYYQVVKRKGEMLTKVLAAATNRAKLTSFRRALLHEWFLRTLGIGSCNRGTWETLVGKAATWSQADDDTMMIIESTCGMVGPTAMADWGKYKLKVGRSKVEAILSPEITRLVPPSPGLNTPELVREATVDELTAMGEAIGMRTAPTETGAPSFLCTPVAGGAKGTVAVELEKVLNRVAQRKTREIEQAKEEAVVEKEARKELEQEEGTGFEAKMEGWRKEQPERYQELLRGSKQRSPVMDDAYGYNQQGDHARSNQGPGKEGKPPKSKRIGTSRKQPVKDMHQLGDESEEDEEESMDGLEEPAQGGARREGQERRTGGARAPRRDREPCRKKRRGNTRGSPEDEMESESSSESSESEDPEGKRRSRRGERSRKGGRESKKRRKREEKPSKKKRKRNTRGSSEDELESESSSESSGSEDSEGERRSRKGERSRKGGRESKKRKKREEKRRGARRRNKERMKARQQRKGKGSSRRSSKKRKRKHESSEEEESTSTEEEDSDGSTTELESDSDTDSGSESEEEKSQRGTKKQQSKKIQKMVVGGLSSAENDIPLVSSTTRDALEREGEFVRFTALNKNLEQQEVVTLDQAVTGAMNVGENTTRARTRITEMKILTLNNIKEAFKSERVVYAWQWVRQQNRRKKKQKRLLRSLKERIKEEKNRQMVLKTLIAQNVDLLRRHARGNVRVEDVEIEGHEYENPINHAAREINEGIIKKAKKEAQNGAMVTLARIHQNEPNARVEPFSPSIQTQPTGDRPRQRGQLSPVTPVGYGTRNETASGGNRPLPTSALRDEAPRERKGRWMEGGDLDRNLRGVMVLTPGRGLSKPTLLDAQPDGNVGQSDVCIVCNKVGHRLNACEAGIIQVDGQNRCSPRHMFRMGVLNADGTVKSQHYGKG